MIRVGLGFSQAHKSQPLIGKLVFLPLVSETLLLRLYRHHFCLGDIAKPRLCIQQLFVQPGILE